MLDAILSFDLSILDFVQSNLKCAFLDWFAPFISMFCDAGIFWIICAVLCLCFRKTRKMGAVIGLSLIFSLLFGNIILKNLVARPRPYTLEGYEAIREALLVKELSDWSFPSGHTSASFAAASAMLCCDKRFGIPALVLAILIALSRIYLFVHFPTDIIGGVILGSLCGILAYFIICAVFRKLSGKAERLQ